MPMMPSQPPSPPGQPPSYARTERTEPPPPQYDGARLPGYTEHEPPSALMADILTLAVASSQHLRRCGTPAAPPVRPWLPESSTMRALRLPEALLGQPRPSFHPQFEPIASEALAGASLLAVATLFAHSCGTTFEALQLTLPLAQRLRGVVTHEMLRRWRHTGAGALLPADAYARAQALLWRHMATNLFEGTVEGADEALQGRLAWAHSEVAPMLPADARLTFEVQLNLAGDMLQDIGNAVPPSFVRACYRLPGVREPAHGAMWRAALDASLEGARTAQRPEDVQEAARAIGRGVAGMRAWFTLELAP